MYAEHNDSEDPSRDWEFSVEFYSDEKAEYNFYITTSEGKEQVRTKGSRKGKQTQGHRKARSSKFIPKRMLRSARHQKSVRTC